MTLDVLEWYYDAVPRSGTRAEDFGPLTLFVREGEGWPFYARPTLSPSAPVPVSVADVERVRARQRELGIPENFEWVEETTPTLRAAIEESGLPVHVHPLMVLDPGVLAPQLPALPDGLTVRMLEPDDPAMPSALTVGHLAFAQSGTQIGDGGIPELAAALADRTGDGSVERMATRIRSGATAIAAAVDADNMTPCSGWHQPVGAVTEIVGVGTLPSARRQGLALAVTAALVADARARGVETVFLSAGDEDVARIYGRLGFRRVGTALIAEA